MTSWRGNAKLPPMRKFFLVILALLTISLIGLLVVPGHLSPTDYSKHALIVSTNRLWTPASQHEILVYVLNTENNLFDHEGSFNLSLKITPQFFDTENVKELYVPLKYLADGTYAANVVVPQTWLPGIATLEIFPTGYQKQQLHKSTINIGKDLALTVLPPKNEVFAGSWLNFRLAVLDRKTGLGQFKAPIRIKLVSPANCLTINRVIHTDIDGTALFTTHIHTSAPEGIYRFEFSHGHEIVNLELLIQSNNKKNAVLTQRIKDKIKKGLPISALLNQRSPFDELWTGEYSINKSTDSTVKSLSLTDIQLAKDGEMQNKARLSYTSANSSYRRIEAWQDGKYLYTSELPLASGTVVINLHKPLQATKPIRFKLWSIGKEFAAYEQALMPKDFDNSVVGKLLKEAEALFPLQAGLPSYADQLFSKQSHTALSRKNKSQNIDFLLPNKTTIKVLHPFKEDVASATQNIASNSATGKIPLQRFFLVDNELMLNRYRFASLKVWLGARRFFTSVISSLSQDRGNLDFITGEAECRALRFPYLNLSEQSFELEKLEGLLIPLADFVIKTNAQSGIKSDELLRANRAIRRLSTLIYVPQRLKRQVSSDSADLNKIGPFSPVFPGEIAVESLERALVTGGTINLVSGERSIPMNLLRQGVIYQNKNYSGQGNKLIKLINSRSAPVIVELEFATTDH